MEPFQFVRAGTVAEAIARLGAGARVLAGGTELVNWMKDGIERPELLVDITGLGLEGIRLDGQVLRIGGLTRLADVARDPRVTASAPGLAQAIEASASPQIRQMGTLGGNLLQRTRCPYYRISAPSIESIPCHLRRPGSGCAARVGDQRGAAPLGGGACIATHPSDPAVALAALDARLSLTGPAGARSIPVGELYGPAGEFTLGPAELLVEIIVPVGERSRSSRFLKVRDRSSFDFALVAGASTRADGRTTLAFGGLSWGPYRCSRAQAELDRAVTAADVMAAIGAEFAGAVPLAGNAFKLELAAGLAVRLLLPAES